jgi:hypothetical protein
MAKITIISSRTVPSKAVGREGKTDAVVVYAIEGGGGNVLVYPSEGFTEQTMLAAIKKDIAQHSALKGKTFEV